MRTLSLLVAAGLASTGLAQTTATVTVGGADTFGCQAPIANPPTLTGGVLASADLEFAYDAPTGVLTLTATNTSAIVAGERNPLITAILFSLPRGAVTGASLLGQTAAAGATPQFALTYAPDGVRAACFGDFDVGLRTSGIHGGVANAAAPMPGGPVGQAAIGPATFRIQLSGPGTAAINANSIAFGFSSGGSHDVNAGAHFMGGGIGGEESGWLGTGEDCNCGMWTSAPAQIGSAVDFCIAGRWGCHLCLWISESAGPTTFPPPYDHLIANVGFPVIDLTLGSFPRGHEVCFPVNIPNDPGLAGTSLYMTVLTGDVSAPLDPRRLAFCGDYQLSFVR